MFDNDVLAALEIQYLAIIELEDSLGRMPSRDEVINRVCEMVEDTVIPTLSLVQ